MPLTDRMRRLDDRIIGQQPVRPRHEQLRLSLLVGLVGTSVVLLLVLIFRKPLLVSSVGGFVGMTIGSGVRWWNASPDGPTPRGMKLLVGLGGISVLAVITAASTMGRWAEGEPQHMFQPSPYERAPATMIVLCARTDRGDPYTYQTVATDKPACKNGAVPKVVLRG